MDFTIFADESGTFVGAGRPLGRHVAVAVVLQGRRSALEASLERAFVTAGLPYPFKSSDFAHRAAVAQHLWAAQRAGGSPPCTASLSTALSLLGPDAARRWIADPITRPLAWELQRIGAAWLAAARTVVTDALRERSGAVTVSLQYGSPPETEQWARSMISALTDALLWIAMQPGGDHVIDAVVDKRTERELEMGDVIAAVEAAREAGAPFARVRAPRTWAQEPNDENAGLHLADVVAHAVGPGPAQFEEVSADVASSLDTTAFRRELRTWVPAALPECFHAGGARPETHGEVRGELDDVGRRPRSETARLARMKLALVELPAFTYRCSAEGALALVRRIARS